jgi:hypothetical protein
MNFSFSDPIAPTTTQRRQIWRRPASPSDDLGLRAMLLKLGSRSVDKDKVGAFGALIGYERRRRYSRLLRCQLVHVR